MQDVLADPVLPALFRSARCLFLDCDGVIFDSNGFKIEAMRQTLAGHSAAEVDAMEVFWRSNGGVSRFVKFEHFYTNIAPRPDVQASMQAAAARFGALSRTAYDGVEPVAAALHYARSAGAARCHVVSGAAQVELESVFAAKHIAELFASILGSPRPKRDLVSGVLAEHACPPSEALLIGDGAMDFRVAQELGIHFVYLAQYSEWTDAARVMAGASHASVAQSWPDLLRALDI